MDIKKFNDDFNYYKSNLSKSFDEKTVNLMLHAYCIGYCEMSNHYFEEFDEAIDINPVLDKINEALAPEIEKRKKKMQEVVNKYTEKYTK